MWFSKKQPEQKEVGTGRDSAEIRELKADHQIEIKKLTNEYELRLKEKDFEMKHHKDKEVLELQNKVSKLESDLSSANVKISMLDKIVDVNAKIVDVKKLVETLINKIPTMDLKNLSVNVGGKN